MPEIGISALPLDYPHSGSATYVRSLVPHLHEVAPDLGIRLFLRWSDETFPGTRFDRIRTPVGRLNRKRGATAQADKLLWEIGSLPVAAALRRVSVLHSTAFAAPPVSSVPIVVTIHDLIPLVIPGYHRSRESALYSRFMARTVCNAAAIITVSQHAKQDIRCVLGIPDDRIHVTYEAAGSNFGPTRDACKDDRIRDRYRLPDQYVLYLGGAERRKNIETLIRAWARRRAELRRLGLQLVVVANFPPPDPLYPDIPSLIQELDLQDDVVRIRWVPEEDKAALYRSAVMFCFPSTYEGFGLPPLEAMACGTPVVCSNATSLPEVVGEAAWTVTPGDIDTWADAIVQIASSTSEQARLRERGLARAAQFSWEKTAKETVEVYRAVLSR